MNTFPSISSPTWLINRFSFAKRTEPGFKRRGKMSPLLGKTQLRQHNHIKSDGLGGGGGAGGNEKNSVFA